MSAPPPIPNCFRLACGHMIANMLDVVVALGIPDKLKDGVIKSSDELAAACRAHPDRLYRVLRALTTEAIFVEHEGKRFSLGPEGEFFRTDHPMSAAPLVRLRVVPSICAYGLTCSTASRMGRSVQRRRPAAWMPSST
jgi:hypothetical protein